jgi:hypothetical protein
MDLKGTTNAGWVEAFFDVSQPYLYVIVLPALVLFALGFRNQALVFALGALAFLAVLSAG